VKRICFTFPCRDISGEGYENDYSKQQDCGHPDHRAVPCARGVLERSCVECPWRNDRCSCRSVDYSGRDHGDIIVVAPGTYFETIDFLGKSITLRSSGGPAATVIDGSGFNSSVVRCVNGEGASTVLEGFTVTGGDADIGGGMLNIGSSPTIIDCIFAANHAGDRGGGMYNRQGSPTIIGSTFEGNSAVEMGGGMFNLRASPTVTECLFTQNSSNKGGGMRNYLNSHPSVTNSTFAYNHAAEEGGGMDNRKNSNSTVIGCVFKGNTAGSGGGGMHNYVGRARATGNPLIVNCAKRRRHAQ
jgi:hypothetical protein